MLREEKTRYPNCVSYLPQEQPHGSMCRVVGLHFQIRAHSALWRLEMTGNDAEE